MVIVDFANIGPKSFLPVLSATNVTSYKTLYNEYRSTKEVLCTTVVLSFVPRFVLSQFFFKYNVGTSGTKSVQRGTLVHVMLPVLPRSPQKTQNGIAQTL